MSIIPPQVPARLWRTFGRFVGPAGAVLFSLILASCAGGGFGGASDTPAVNPVSQPAPAASGPISPESQRNVAEALAGLKLGDETPPISPENIAVSDDAEILNRNPFSSPSPAARASGWGARADSTRKTPGYKAFEIAVPSENPLMTVAVWISETPPDYPEGKPEQDPEANRKFLYLRLQVFIAVEHVALVEGGGVEVLDSEVIVVEEKRPDPKPVTPEAVTAETVCESGSLSANGQTQAQLDAGLISAAEGDDLAGACEYLRRGANVDARESGRYHRRTALMIAANDGFLDLAKLLHANGADVNLHGGSHDGGLYGRGWSALHYSAVAGNVEIARWLLDAGAELESTWDGVKTALWEASYWGRPGVVELLLSRGADVSRSPGDLSGIRAAVRETTVNYPYTRTMLSYYYPKPSADSLLLVVSLLASGGAELNERRRGGRSILDEAVNRDNARVAKVLRQFGGKCFLETGPLCGVPEVVTAETICESGSLSANGLTQAQLDAGLISAAEGNNLAGACEYLRRGANVDARESGRYYKRTALMIATTDGRLELAKLLYANGADVNLDGGNHNGYDVGRGWTALQYSGAAGRPELAGWLLDSGAELNSEWESGKTALWEAAYWGRPDVVELLLSRGAETETYYNGGATPLHAAVLLDEWVSARVYWANGPAFRYKRNAISYSYPIPTADEHGQVVSLLLSHDAEVNARYQGRSPLDYAARQGDERLSAMLRDAGGICYVETGVLCGIAEVVTAETVCESGSLSADGQTQAQLDAGLLSAAKGNNLAGACEHLRRGADMNARDRLLATDGLHRRTPLMLAAVDNRLELAKLLVGNGASVNYQSGGPDLERQDGAGWSALMYAAGAGQVETATYLIDQGAELDMQWASGYSALHEAAIWGRYETVELLIARGANVNLRDYALGGTPLHGASWGANSGHFTSTRPSSRVSWNKVIKALLDGGADVNARRDVDDRPPSYGGGASPLDSVVVANKSSRARKLRDAGGYCYVQTSSLCAYPPVVTAVTLAVTTAVTSETVCESGSLSANGLTQAELDEGLLSAARGNNLINVCEYLRRGANIEAEDAPVPRWAADVMKRTPLVIAAVEGRLELARLLLDNGANVNWQSGRKLSESVYDSSAGWSALLQAAGAGHSDVVELLLDRGADINIRWDFGRTALHEAAIFGRASVVELLLDRGVEVDARDLSGATALYGAAWGSNANHHLSNRPTWEGKWDQVLDLLLDAGAEVNARTTRTSTWGPAGRVYVSEGWDGGRTPLDAAVSVNKRSRALKLRSHGGVCNVESGSLCPPLVTVAATPDPVTLEVVTAETVCESGSLSANGLTQAQLDAGLISAADGNDLPEACEYLRRGANVNARESGRYYKRTALMIAANDGRLELAKLLRANGAEVNLHGGNHDGGRAVPGWSALHYAAAAGHAEMAGWLLDAGAGLETTWDGHKTALWEAAYWGRPEVAAVLLSRGADSRNQDGGSVSALRMAVYDGPPGWRTSSWSYRRMAISYSYPKPSEDALASVISLLAAGGADVNERRQNRSVLDDAVSRNRARFAEVLREFGGKCVAETGPLCGVADVATAVTTAVTLVVTAETVCESGSLSANGLTQAQLDAGLISAADGNDLPEACEYLRRGANVNARESGRYYKRTALMIAANDGRLELAKLLRANGAEVNLHGGNHDGGRAVPGWSALHYAAAAGHAEMAGWLLDAGAGLETTWDGHKTALWEAAYWGRPEVAAVLLSRGADSRNQDGGSVSALRMAVYDGPPGWRTSSWSYRRMAISYSYPKPSEDALASVISLLAAGGADVNERRQNRSVLDDAVSRNRARFAEVLREFGGKCVAETGPLCGVADVATAVTTAVTLVVTAETVCESGSLSANGLTQAQLDAGLISAADGNDLPEACEYLRRGANVNARESGRYYKRTALMIAANDGRLELAKLLRANGAEVNLHGGNHDGGRAVPGWSALHYAAAAGHAEMAGWLLDAGAGLETTWDGHKTALWEAAYWGRPEVAAVLLSRGADSRNQDGGSVSALRMAVYDGPPGWRTSSWSYRRMAISYSYPKPSEDALASVISLLAAGGADVNERRQNRSVLDDAVSRNRARFAEVLREFGGKCVAETGPLCGVADVATAVTTAVTLVVTAETVCESGSLSANGLTQAQLDAGLISAADGNDLPEACEYLRRGANVNARESGRYYKRTALMIAANDGRLELAKLLRANGAEVNLHGGNHDGGRAVPGWSALHYAAAAGHAEMAGWLLDAGAGLETTWDGHKTALWEAAYWGRPEVAAVLLSRGADSRNQDGGSVSALRMAVYDGPPGWRTSSWSYRRMAISYSYPKPSEDALASVISLLAAGGADVNERRQNRSVLDDAVSRNRARFAEVLREFGGKCVAETGPLCGVADVATAVTTAVTLVVTAETVCESGSLSANGLTQAQLDAGLISAADGNDLPEACEYLRRGANVNARESGRYYKRTALMIAANDGRLELAKLLRANGAEVNLHGGNHDGGRAVPGWSALHYAAAAGHAEMAGWLLDAGAGLETTWDGHKTALWEAAYWGRPEVAAVLLSRGADSRNQDGGSVSALRMAVYDGPPGWRTSSWSYRRMAISYSYPKPSEDALASVISLLAAGGADVNERRQNRSVLDDAVSRNRARFAEVLREFGGKCVAETGPLCGVADVATAVTTAVTLVVTAETVCESGSLSANGLTQAQLDAGLISAADGNDLPEACEYLRRGANVNARESGRYYKRTALMIAANDGRLELAKLLRANGAEVNLHGGNHDGGRAVPGWSALHYAAAAGHAEMAGWLLDAGAGLETTWDGHKTALWEAAYWGRPEVAAVLLSRGADSRNQDGGSVSALRMAVYDGPPGWRTSSWSYRRMAISYSYPKPSEDALASVISLLAAGGADVNERRQNRSVLDDAVSRNRARFAEVLREFGGKCVAETGPLCGVADVATAVTTAVTLVVTAETVCESGSLSANGLTQAQLDAGLISAADGNDLPEACEYLRRGANVNARESGRYYKRTALMIAANDGRMELAKLLRANGAEVNLHGGNHDGGRAVPGWSALHYAAAAGHAEMAGWLLDAGAGLETTWDGHKTALWEAAYWGRPEVAAVLLSRGADSRNQDGGSVSALRMAVYDGPPGWRTSSWSYRRMAISYSYPKPSEDALASVISLLAAGGADVNERRQNRSVLDDAVSRNRARFAEVLREFGGKCVAETGPLCGVADVATAVTTAVTLVVTAETVCESGSLSANGLTQAQLDAGLISAADGNDLPEACEYLRRGANVNARESGRYYKRTALMIAANDGRMELAKLLRANGAEVNLHGGNHDGGRAVPGWSALHYAAAAGHAEMAGWLLDAGAGLETTWDGHKTALWEAAYWGRPEVAAVLLSRGADSRNQDGGSVSALRMAVYDGPPGWRTSSWSYRRMAISYSYPKPSEDALASVISLLAAGGADVNERRQNRSVLDDAVSRNRARFAEVLREFGGKCVAETGPLCGVADVATAVTTAVTLVVTAETVCESGSLSANGLTQAQLDAGLISAAQANNLEDVCEYLRRGASVEAQEQSGTYRRTALMIAAYDRHLDLAKLLHANGADVNSRVGNGGMGGRANPGRWRTHGDSGFTALMYAAGAAGAAGSAEAAGRAEMIGWLLDNGADPNLGDSRGRLPLFEAAFYGRVDVMGLLLDGGADVDGTDVWGLTPLHAAGPHYNYGSGPEWSYAATVAGYLLSRGANVNALDSWGRSPLDMYAEWSHPNAAAVLRNAGGKCFVQTGPLCGVDVAVDFSSSGSGTVSAEGDGDAVSDGDNVRQGATVMFTATPAAGHYVSGWSGNCAEAGEVADGLDGAAKFCAVSADSALSVRAEFSEIPSLAGPLCPSGSLSANGLTIAELNMTLRLAARGGDATRACEALRRGAEVNDNLDDTEFTPLQEAVSGGHLEAAKLLLANGAEVNKRKDGAGHSPLDLAANRGDAAAAEILRAAGEILRADSASCQPVLCAGLFPWQRPTR